MVNGWLTSAGRGQPGPPRGIAPRAWIARIFATKAALTKPFNAVGRPRSRFGPADSWVIKMREQGGSFCLGVLRDQGPVVGLFRRPLRRLRSAYAERET